MRADNTIEPAGVTSDIQVECIQGVLPFPSFFKIFAFYELNCYPTEQLASLPKWMRYRILSSVPALDLARLESTPVTNGIDTDKIWKLLLKATDKDRYNFFTEREVKKPFQLNISKDRYCSDTLLYRQNPAIEEIVSDIKHSELVSIGKCHLAKVASDLLKGKGLTDAQQLVSIPGKLVLSNLLIGSEYQKCKNPLCNENPPWPKQAISLAVKESTSFIWGRSHYYRGNICIATSSLFAFV
jgi:hypothetical protein